MRGKQNSNKKIKRKCHNCGSLYRPDARAKGHQRYCKKPECKAASKQKSQAKWVAKNPTYFTGGGSTERSRVTRANQKAKRQNAQAAPPKSSDDDILTIDNEGVNWISSLVASASVQQEMIGVNSRFIALIIGMLCMVSGCMQQEEIGLAYEKMLFLGQEVLGKPP